MHNYLVNIFFKYFEDGKTATMTLLMETNTSLYCIHCSESIPLHECVVDS